MSGFGGFDDRMSEKITHQQSGDQKSGFGSFEDRRSEKLVSQNEKNMMQKSLEKPQEKPTVSFEILMTDVGNLMEKSRAFMKEVL